MKVTTQYPLDSKLVRPFDRGGTFYLALMGKASYSKNKSAQKARRELGKFDTTCLGSFLVNLYSKELTRIAHMLG